MQQRAQQRKLTQREERLGYEYDQLLRDYYFTARSRIYDVSSNISSDMRELLLEVLHMRRRFFKLLRQ